MPTPNVDTSPKAVADALRKAQRYILDHAHKDIRKSFSDHVLSAELGTLADALERQAGVTWEERAGRAVQMVYPYVRRGESAYEIADYALRAAFPELAPTDDGSCYMADDEPAIKSPFPDEPNDD